MFEIHAEEFQDLQFRLMTINIRFSAKELHVTGYIKIELM
jgi:hypothetical protein